MSETFQQTVDALKSFGIARLFVDVDGVILDSRRALAEFTQKHYPEIPLKIKPDALRGWAFLGIEREIYEKILHDPRQIALKKPLVDGVKQGLQIFVAAGLQVDLLSSIDPSMFEQRLAHLREDGLPFGQLLTVPRDASKEAYLRENAPVIMIDDYKKHVVTADNANCVGVLFSQPYNKDEEGLRLKNWSQSAIQEMLEAVLKTVPTLDLPAPCRKAAPEKKARLG